MCVEMEQTALQWLENQVPWTLAQREFYEQHEFSLLHHDLPLQVSFLTAPSLIDYFKAELGQAFGVSFESRFDVTAHRLTPKQVIRIHNDYLPGQETHRLLFQLNRSWDTSQGGLLILFSEPRAEAAAKFILPKSRSAFGFEISPRSLHAVSTIRSGSRFTLVYSFYARQS